MSCEYKVWQGETSVELQLNNAVKSTVYTGWNNRVAKISEAMLNLVMPTMGAWKGIPPVLLHLGT